MADQQDSSRRIPGRVPGASRKPAAHVQGEKKKTPFIIIGVVIIALAGGGYFLLHDPNKIERELTQQLGNPEAHSIPSAKGQQGSLTLGDETAVKLGSESSVKIPASFNDKVRGVSVTGTAVITVKPLTGQSETEKPFRARLRNVDVESKGGSFAVRAYENEDKDVLVEAREGALMINPNNKEGVLQPLAVGSGIAIDKDGKTRALTAEETAQAFSWADGNLTINNVTLSDLVPTMDRWFNTIYFVLDPNLKTRPVTAVLPLASSKQALDAISTAASVHVAFRGDTLTLADGAPPAAKTPAKKGK